MCGRFTTCMKGLKVKSNPDKCHLLISNNERVAVYVGHYEINVLARTAPFIGLSKRRMLMKAFFNSQFGFVPVAQIIGK